MRIHIATDHAGLELSAHLQRQLRERGYQVKDHGPSTYDPLDDYPQFCIDAAEAVVADQAAGELSLGIVLGGSGNGEQISANKVFGARAALIWNLETAQLARQHNNANIAALGGRQHSTEEATAIVMEFLTTAWDAEERHQRRIDQITEYERTRNSQV